MATPIGLIGGSGFGAGLLGDGVPQDVETRWGRATVELGAVAGRDVVALARHGAAHTVPPHRVPHRASIAALHQLGVRQVLATAAVGGISGVSSVGELVVPHQLLDLTGRVSTFFDGPDVVHVDLTDPYCRRLADALGGSAGVRRGATYAQTVGPRFETAAEIRALATLGGDLVGMTVAPEATLAREAGCCYATLAIVTNAAAGSTGSTAVTVDDVAATMQRSGEHALAVLRRAVELLGEPTEDCCGAVARRDEELP